jgi:hypothetical protein
MSEAKLPRTIPARTLVLEQRWLESGDWATKTPTLNEQLSAEEMNRPSGLPELKPADHEVVMLLQPSLESQLNRSGSSLTGQSIMEEIHVARLAGKLRPYSGREDIGAYKKREPNRPAPMLLSPERIAQDRRKEMLELRAANDRALARLLDR